MKFNKKYIYSLNGIELPLKTIAQKLIVNESALTNRVIRSNQRIYNETIMGYKFKAVKIINNI